MPDHVVFRSFVNETVVLNLQTGRYHGLNPTGGRMLEALQRGPTVGEAVGQLARECEVPAARVEEDVREFCADLVQRGLLEISLNGSS